MLVWMIYVVLVSLLLGLAALAFERSARLRKTNTRWLWGGSILASLLVPFAISSISVQLPALPSAANPTAAMKTVALREMTLRELSPSDWLASGAGEVAKAGHLDGTIAWIWLATSASLALLIVVGSLHLAWRRRRWVRGTLSGTPVFISEDLGPAIVGLFAPHIVVPRWLMDATSLEQELVLAHEDAHLEAHDAQLLAVALLLLVCMPWNLPLWWQLRRLRFAIEIDCDARVVRRGHGMRPYGEVLIAIGERQSSSMAVVAGMSESRSFLEQRLRHLLQEKVRWTSFATIALACTGSAMAAVAAQVSPPNVQPFSAAALRPEVVLDHATLDRYAGFYRLNDNAVFSVTRDADRLITQATGHRPVPVYAQARSTFFAKVADAQISFVVDSTGEATSLISHQGGRDLRMPRIDAATAEQIAARIAEKVKNQSAAPGTESALRRLVDGILNGRPGYDEMAPALASATREQLPRLQATLVGLGAVRSIRFMGVGPRGEDVYTVDQEGGSSRWRIALNIDGSINTAIVGPGP